MRFIGGANIPSLLGWRLNATWPLGVLTIEGGRLHLCVRALGPFAKLFGIRPLECAAQEIAEVFLCHGMFGTSGVGFRTEDTRYFYFLTGRIQDVLEVCRQQGFAVSDEKQRVRFGR
ncbi:hypothetical protein [Streptomyces sp. NPDC048663]|uniref:hypothetical protein n=1 Tax=Streptomyces sp. NPDC048663 TaxID=3155638 RepID=UPI00342EB0C1